MTDATIAKPVELETDARAVVRLAYYASSQDEPLADECNVGIEEVAHLLERVRSLGLDVEFVDTSGWSEDERAEAYSLAATPAVVRHSKTYSVRRAFGTRRRGGEFFGRGVPALVVYRGAGGLPTDVYPHYEGDRPVTIRDFLRRLLEDPGSALGSGPRFTPETVASLRRLRHTLFQAREVPGDSTDLIRQAREGR